MEYHEYANIYRMLPEKELQALSEDIKAKGQLLPITSYEGKILDGRNRHRACEMAGVDPKIEEYTGDDPLGLIASLNDHRRHDTDNERALVGARMANLKHGTNRHNLETPMGASRPAISITRAAELSGSSRKNIERAKPIVQSGIPELQDMAESGEVSIRAASEVAKLTPEEQRKAVAGGVKGVKDAAKKLRNTKKKSADSSPPQEAANGILAYDGSLYRRLNARAVHATVEKVYNTAVEFDPLKGPPPPKVEWNKKETARIHLEHPATADDLVAASPVDVTDAAPRDVLELLFPNSDGLLCLGIGKYHSYTGPLRGFPHLETWEFIVPCYMNAQMGKTAEGKLSYHSKENTGPPRFIVFDFDDPPPEEHPSIITHLGKFRQVVMVLSTGGKGLHAWFPTTDRPTDDELFWRVGITLGADRRIPRNPSQFVRLPLGTRTEKYKGNRQRILYFNHEPIPQ